MSPTAQGDELVIEVKDTTTTPATYVPVNDMNRFSRRTTRATGRQRVFMRTTPRTTRGAREWTSTLSGFLNTDDPGQDIIRLAMETDVPITLKIMPDGVNGFSQDFYVGNQSHDANPDPQNMQEGGWELTDASDPVIVGTGPIL